MIVNRNKANHLSQSLISPVLPGFLLLFVLIADDKKQLPKPPRRKKNPSWDPGPSTWGCGSAGSKQRFCQPWLPLRNTDTAAKFIGTGAVIIMMVGFVSGVGAVLGSLIIGYARNPSLKKQLFSYECLSFALSEALGSFT
ncbi:ATP synthase F(0) complex subunit C1, mitochondrial-like [Cricetulus griseus]|uniref:ATP synthase F(0) complex subunit C1, mitochondrial-like n=1 Tax=Cricetulus griseus TaxID=10029 RepID=A0A9J7HAE9_CRIGR|nr:ATP synthase F(0) complex subunit C1, mitochondrial-like [Cricetulus griseus]XP_035312905.1 ATP synthase F(0) complex subunit C1, mitochondrial-like [Cricetulus griseus]